MKNLELRPITLVFASLSLIAAGTMTGDALHASIPYPFGHAAKLNLSELTGIYSSLQSTFDGKISDQAAIDGARKGLVDAGGDPYTEYMTAQEAKTFNDGLTGKLFGIGAELGLKNNLLTIIDPIIGAPAEAAGIRTKDILISINDEDTFGLSVDAAAAKLRGPQGTTVKVKILRPNQTDPIELTITRAEVIVPSVNWILKPGHIAYINVSRFGPDTAANVEQAIKELKAKGATKVILDLRNNGGGYLDAAVKIASQFLPAGKPIVEERVNNATHKKLTAQSGGLLISLPTIVLIDGGTASASEIVAGALHDNHAAQLVGEKSFGKGSVQEIKPLPGGARLKVTVAHWYTPSGINIDKEGLQPDTEIKLSNDDYNANHDPQLDQALNLLK